MTVPTVPPAVPGGRVLRVARLLLVLVGVAGIVLGAVVLVQDVSPTRYGGLLLWLAASAVLHDAVLAPVVVAVSLLVRRRGRRVPLGALVIAQVGVVVGVVLTLVVVPEIHAQRLGPRNDTVLPLDYGLHLAVAWVVVVVATAAAVAGYLVVRVRRQKRRPSTDHA